MKEVFYNKNNLKKEDIDEEVIRVKGLIINSKNEILLGYCNYIYQFPGGHLEAFETLNQCLKREIKEETGMEIDTDGIDPYLLIKYYNKNYFDTHKNRCNSIYYFIIRTDNEISLEKTEYTKDEKEGNYKLEYINLNEVEDVLINNATNYPNYKIISEEMLLAIKEYKNM